MRFFASVPRSAGPARTLPALLARAGARRGCGKASSSLGSGGALGGRAPAAVGALSITTRNTIRLGGAEAALDAAAVAGASYPGLTAASRPQAVVLAGEGDFEAALAASVLAAAPLGAPLLYANGDTLPAATAQALAALHLTGAPALGGAQVIAVGTAAAAGAGYRTLNVPVAAASAEPASVAAALEHLFELARGGAPRRVIVLAGESAPALQMPAAGLSAESGAPILLVSDAKVPAATVAVLKRLSHPAIYLLGASTMTARTISKLAHLGSVTQIGGDAKATENSIAIARFTDGSFGWGVKEPGHGLVFASATRPLDAPAAALLSASGDYGPLLLLESPAPVGPALSAYLSDIQPAYGRSPQYEPVRGAYNHGWLIGDEGAISDVTQAELDSLLEISPSRAGAEEGAEAPAE